LKRKTWVYLYVVGGYSGLGGWAVEGWRCIYIHRTMTLPDS